MDLIDSIHPGHLQLALLIAFGLICYIVGRSSPRRTGKPASPKTGRSAESQATHLPGAAPIAMALEAEPTTFDQGPAVAMAAVLGLALLYILYPIWARHREELKRQEAALGSRPAHDGGLEKMRAHLNLDQAGGRPPVLYEHDLRDVIGQVDPEQLRAALDEHGHAEIEVTFEQALEESGPVLDRVLGKRRRPCLALSPRAGGSRCGLELDHRGAHHWVPDETRRTKPAGGALEEPGS